MAISDNINKIKNALYGWQVRDAIAEVIGELDTKIGTSNTGRVVPGIVEAFAGGATPNGYLLCNGQAVSRTTYAELFAVIGVTYGAGNGSTTFNIPDLKGRVVVGLDASQAEFAVLARWGGEKNHTLTHDELPPISYFKGSVDSYDRNNAVPPGSLIAKGDTFGLAFPTVGKNSPINVVQPYTTLNYIIKY